MVPFIGPSYTLTNDKADRQRSINLHLVGLEASRGQILDSTPGYRVFASLGVELRGALEVGSRTFVVAGSTLYELYADGTFTARGTLSSSTGLVSMAYGLSQLVIVDGGGYVLTLGTNAFQIISAPGFFGANTVDFIDNYFVFTKDRSGQKFQISAINDATVEDALDFASAESSPDDLVGHVVLHAGLLLMGTLTGELWINTGNNNFPFERSRGSGFSVGLMARNTLRRVDNAAMWLGRDETGAGIVYRLAGGQPQRISTQAIEQILQASTDLTKASAYTYQDKGLTYYVISAPGVTRTFEFEVASSSWNDLCDLDALGQYKADRGVCHCYAFGKHLIGGSDGFVYALDNAYYLKGTDPLVRERISPHDLVPGIFAQFFDRLIVNCTTGGAAQGDDPQLELTWADYGNGPAEFGNFTLRSIGRVGQQFARVVFHRLGFSRDRVWKLRFSGNAPFSIISVDVDARKGTN
jgi:hypothetical protein